MKKPRFTNEQIAFALKPAESGLPVEEVCRKLGVIQPTFYRRLSLLDYRSPNKSELALSK